MTYASDERNPSFEMPQVNPWVVVGVVVGTAVVVTALLLYAPQAKDARKLLMRNTKQARKRLNRFSKRAGETLEDAMDRSRDELTSLEERSRDQAEGLLKQAKELRKKADLQKLEKQLLRR